MQKEENYLLHEAKRGRAAAGAVAIAVVGRLDTK